MNEAGKGWERGRLVRIALHPYHSHNEDNHRGFVLRTQCGRDLRIPSNKLADVMSIETVYGL